MRTATTPHLYQPIYTVLRFLRHERSWKQAEVSRRSGIPQPTLSAIELGRLNPSRDELERLAQVFNYSPPEALLQRCAIPDPEPTEVEA